MTFSCEEGMEGMSFSPRPINHSPIIFNRLTSFNASKPSFQVYHTFTEIITILKSFTEETTYYI